MAASWQLRSSPGPRQEVFCLSQVREGWRFSTCLKPNRTCVAAARLRPGASASWRLLLPAQASWHEERQLTAAGPAMSEAYPLCALRLRRAAAAAPTAPETLHRQRQYGREYDYELEVCQSFGDGLHHDEGEAPGSTTLRVRCWWGSSSGLRHASVRASCRLCCAQHTSTCLTA